MSPGKDTRANIGRRLLWFGVRLLIISLTLVASACGPSLEERQQTLAQDLGVSIDDYPAPTVFPVGYFRSIIERGSTADEVHEIVQKYDKVLNCEVGKHSEIYYFVGTDDDRAIRMEVRYDAQWEVFRVDSEDRNSRSFTTDDCVEGQYGDKT